VGTSLLLFDEDDSAIAFVARDAIMQRLIPGSRDAFTPLVERVRTLWEQHGVSTIMATGGLGEYLEVADTVIIVEGFQLSAATGRAPELVAEHPVLDRTAPLPFRPPLVRCPLTRGLGGTKGRGLRAEMRGRDTLCIGRDVVDLGALGQLVDHAQARAAGDAILYAVEKDYVNGQASVAEVLDRVFADVDASGLGALATRRGEEADYALPRRHEVAAVLNRMRSLQVRMRRPADERATPATTATAGPADVSPLPPHTDPAPTDPVPAGLTPADPTPTDPTPAHPTASPTPTNSTPISAPRDSV
jgi:predicted ABC-class ATPase